MTEGQRKFWIALFGAIAAIVAAIGDGWVVHLALSYQDNSNTATNGGVVIQDTQGSPGHPYGNRGQAHVLRNTEYWSKRKRRSNAGWRMSRPATGAMSRS